MKRILVAFVSMVCLASATRAEEVKIAVPFLTANLFEPQASFLLYAIAPPIVDPKTFETRIADIEVLCPGTSCTLLSKSKLVGIQESLDLSFDRCGVRLPAWESDREVLQVEAPLHLFTTCPIIRSESFRVFGSFLGSGTALQGFGEWTLRSISHSGDRLLIDRDGGRSVIVGVATDGDRLLASLRRGLLFGFLTENQSAIDKAKEDPTLRVTPCNQYHFLSRAGTAPRCNDIVGLEINSLFNALP